MITGINIIIYINILYEVEYSMNVEECKDN